MTWRAVLGGLQVDGLDAAASGSASRPERRLRCRP